MNILFRADSSSFIGIGHLVRCLSIAESFDNSGATIHFICKAHKGHASKIIPKKYNLKIIEDGAILDIPKNGISEEQFLGSCVSQEISLMNEYISNNNIDAVVFDHYGIDAEYEKQINSKCIVVIDDMMNRQHFADILIDHNLSALKKNYQDLNLKESTLFLLGPMYSIVKNSFLESREIFNRRDSKLNKVLINFGGADITNESLRLVEAIHEKELSYKVVVLISEKHETFEKLCELSKLNENISILNLVSNMSSFITEFDFIIGACGTSAIERAIVGIPSAMITVAKNQIILAEAFDKKDVSIYLGDSKNLSKEIWSNYFDNIENNWSGSKLKAKKAMKLYDGQGLERIKKAIYENTNSL